MYDKPYNSKRDLIIIGRIKFKNTKFKNLKENLILPYK